MNLNTYLSEQHCAIVGRTGAGKSYAAKTVIEYLLDAGRRVCIIDPTGAQRDVCDVLEQAAHAGVDHRPR